MKSLQRKLTWITEVPQSDPNRQISKIDLSSIPVYLLAITQSLDPV
jgi:hypothetical protein